ncbi:ankyrin repeat-containing domain protein [Trichoderma ceciliae]
MSWVQSSSALRLKCLCSCSQPLTDRQPCPFYCCLNFQYSWPSHSPTVRLGSRLFLSISFFHFRLTLSFFPFDFSLSSLLSLSLHLFHGRFFNSPHVSSSSASSCPLLLALVYFRARSIMEKNKTKTGLLDIPNEIISQIGRYLTHHRHIAALARTCRLFNAMFGDYLYQHNEKHGKASCLMWAASMDKMETLQRAMRAGVRLESHPQLIFVVSCNGSGQVAEAVLSAPGANPMAEDSEGWTPLTLAASYGHSNVVKKLVEHGANFSSHTRGGWSPVNVACCHGSFGVAKLLLDGYGASMECDSESGWSALRSASTYGHTNILTYLLARGADITIRNSVGWTCLHSAAHEGHTSAVEALLDHGSDPADAAHMGWTALTLATDKGHHDTVSLLLERGVDIEQACTNLWTSLCLAADHGDIFMIKLLLDHGANIAAKAIGGWFPLSLAATNGHYPAVNIMLDYGADIHMTTHTGWTPLMTASDNGHATTAKLLIDRGADVEAKSATGWTALFCAADGRHLLAAKVLLGHGANCMATSVAGWTPGIRAAHSGGLRLLELFLKMPGFEVDHLDRTGRSAFFHAAMRGHTEMVQKMLPLTRMANNRDRYGTSPIFAAARNGHRRVVEVLIKEGYADFEERDFLGCTLFASAQRSKKKQFVKFLKRHAQQAGIDIWLDDPAGKRTKHKYDYSTCLCGVCGRSSVHVQQSYVCDTCNGGLILCAECINAGQICENDTHIWRAHRCYWNQDFGVTPDYLAASANIYANCNGNGNGNGNGDGNGDGDGDDHDADADADADDDQ